MNCGLRVISRGVSSRHLSCCLQSRLFLRPSVRSVVVAAEEKEVRCYVNEEGHLVCDRLDPGDYIVKGTDSSETGKEAAEEGVAFCYITDSGELVCEGLPEGQYTIERANDEQMKEILKRMENITEGKTPVAEIPTQPETEANEKPEVKETFDPETGVRCYVNADGVMVCERLDPGDYVVKSIPKAEEKGETSSDRVTFCYITDDGELICEGIDEGTYHIEKATDEDLSAMLKHVEKITENAEN